MLINEIKEMIYDFLYVQNNDFKNAIPGGLFYIENSKESKDVSFPYAVYQFLPGSYDKDSGTKWENPILQITIYDNSGSSHAASDAGEKCDARLEDAENLLITPSYYVLSITRISPPREYRTINNLWHHSRDYKIELQRK